MPDYPGVYVEEISTRTREIAGAPTSTAAFVGFAPSGPTDPTIISGIVEYEATFGKTAAAQPLASAVADYFRNGGTRAVVLRVAPGGRARAQGGQLIGDAKANTGLHALSRVDEPIGLLLAPDAAYLPEQDAADVANAAASLAESCGVFHIADVPKAIAGNGVAAAVQWSAGVAHNRNLALYYPWLVAGAGTRKANSQRPPSAIAAGIYARLDQARGVWKAPAGQDAVAVGITGLSAQMTSAQMDSLHNADINAIRKMPGGEIVLWGARTFAHDAEWKYVNVRRLVLFLERSIEEGVSWAVFEPNDETLWAQVRLEISSFLYTAWRAGAFQGSKPNEAYFVKCDATTMTQNDIDNGRLIALIGVAPVKPAEFVLIRIGLAAKAP